MEYHQILKERMVTTWNVSACATDMLYTSWMNALNLFPFLLPSPINTSGDGWTLDLSLLIKVHLICWPWLLPPFIPHTICIPLPVFFVIQARMKGLSPEKDRAISVSRWLISNYCTLGGLGSNAKPQAACQYPNLPSYRGPESNNTKISQIRKHVRHQMKIIAVQNYKRER